MIASLFLAAAMFAESKTLALQIQLDREGYSCSAIDGAWGPKSQEVLARYLTDKKILGRNVPPPTPEAAYDMFFSHREEAFRIETVTEADLAALVKIPEEPADKAKLSRMGYETIKEMFAERGHLSQRALEKMNPGVDWKNIRAGTKLVIPDFPSIDSYLKEGEKTGPRRVEAAVVKISISKCMISAYDKNDRTLAVFPCSIAANKTKIPPHGELKITTYVARPNYTYTPDYTPPGEKVKRYIYPEGENCPVGVAWMGLNLPGYGMHGTPRPESIGFTGSHGCFRLANWNAARLYAMCRSGTKVIIEP